MISYREKQLLTVQKMLQDDTTRLLDETISIFDNINSKNHITSYVNIFDKNISTYEELVNLAVAKGYDHYIRVTDLLSPKELADIDRRKNEIEELFKKKTGIVNKKDLTFLIIAIAMQCLRQYFLTDFKERLNDNEAAAKVKKGEKEHSNRSHKYYSPSLTEIITNPVPFDANFGADGALSGGGKLGHRVMTLGHDPLLGLFFGTMNIATSTLTTSKFQSYHITTLNKRDYFGNKADMSKIIYYSKDKLLNQGIEGKTIMVVSLLKEIQHLRSDVNSKNSLGLPFVSAIDPQLASELASIGLDAGNLLNVGKQASMTILIDSFISLIYVIYTSLSDNNYKNMTIQDKKILQVRLRKILLYSNFIASTSNAIYVAITRDTSKLDIGGMLVTLSHLLLDTRFILKVKDEFIQQSINSDFEERLNKIDTEINLNFGI